MFPEPPAKIQPREVRYQLISLSTPYSWTSHVDSGQFLGHRKGGSSQTGRRHLGLYRAFSARDGPGQFPARLNMRPECVGRDLGGAETRAEAAGFGQILDLFFHSLIKRRLTSAQHGAWCSTSMCPLIHWCRVPIMCQTLRAATMTT